MAIQFKSATGFDYVSSATPLPVTIVGGGTGDVDGPASATDNAIVRFDGTTGKLIQNSAVTIADTTGNMDLGAGTINTTGSITAGAGSFTTLAASSAASFAAGSDASPSITFSGDPNTGFYSGGADDLYVSAGGAKALSITNAASVYTLSIGNAGRSVLKQTAGGDTVVGGASGSNQTDVWVNGAAVATLTSAGLSVTGTLSSTSTLSSNTTIRLKGYTVAGLPAGTQGDTAFVTDALAPSFLVAVAGGGSVVTPVFYNGTNWVSY